MVLWGWVTVRGFGGHVFTAPRGTVVETDAGGVVLQLTPERLTTHVVVAALQWGAERPQPWRDPGARDIWRAPPTQRATIWSRGVERHLPGALSWLRDCGDASPPPAEMRGALEGLYGTGDEPGPPHHFLVAADHTAAERRHGRASCRRGTVYGTPRHDPSREKGGKANSTPRLRPPFSSRSTLR